MSVWPWWPSWLPYSAEWATAYLTALLVLVGLLTAAVLICQSWYLRRSVNAMIAEFRATHRPKIRIKHVWLHRPLEGGEAVQVQLVTVNTGSLPARITSFDVVTHVVLKFRSPPNDPFAGRNAYGVANVLKSGMSLDHEPRDAGFVTLDEIGDIRKGDAIMYCFAYVDYTEADRPGTPMKTACCRQLEPDQGDALSTYRGAFIAGQESSRSEHNYAD